MNSQLSKRNMKGRCAPQIFDLTRKLDFEHVRFVRHAALRLVYVFIVMEIGTRLGDLMCDPEKRGGLLQSWTHIRAWRVLQRALTLTDATTFARSQLSPSRS